MPKAGYLTVIGIVLLAVGLGVFNLVYQRQRTANATAYWGHDRVPMIDADQVELALLENADAPGPPATSQAVKFLTVDGGRYREAETKPGDEARGLHNVRHAWLDDGAFLWDASPPSVPPRYRYALHFSHDGQEATVLFSDDGLWVRSPHQAKPLKVKPHENGVSPFLAFLHEQFPPPKADDKAEPKTQP